MGMGWLFYALIAFFIINYIISEVQESGFTWGKFVRYTISGTLLSILVVTMFTFVVAIIGESAREKNATPFKTRTATLVQSKLTTTIDGHFVLGCGNIEGKDVYRFYIDNDGVYQLDYLDADKSYVKEIDGEPYVEYYISMKANGTPTWFERALFGNKWEKFMITPAKRSGVLYIPKGSIMQQFDMNL